MTSLSAEVITYREGLNLRYKVWRKNSACYTEDQTERDTILLSQPDYCSARKNYDYSVAWQFQRNLADFVQFSSANVSETFLLALRGTSAATQTQHVVSK